MLTRCYSPKSAQFKNYGAKGISVCARWRESFENFIEDMGPSPSINHSLDRIDTNGNYEKANCRWATMKVQQRNRTNNLVIEIDGLKKTLAEWCEIYGVDYGRTHQRIVKLGIDPLMSMTKANFVVGKKHGNV